MLSIRWKDPLSTMFPSLWSTSSQSIPNVTTKQNISPPTQDSFNHQANSRQQHQQFHGDIEAAADQILTPVFVQPTSSQLLPQSPGTGNSITSSRTYGDPFQRRNGATSLHHISADGSLETSTSTGSTISNLSQQQQVSSSAMASYSDALPNNSLRSGAFPVADAPVLLVDSNIPRTSTISRAGGVSVGTTTKALVSEPKLIHRALLRIPLHIRFALNGFVCNILFMVAYNYAALMFERTIAVSTIYSVVYFIFIPLGHAFVSLFVFGWPERYIASLMNNFPIGLSAIAIGSVLTGYLDSIHFTDSVDEFIRDNFIFFKMPPRLNAEGILDGEESQFWSSLVVLFVTSLWTYGLSIYVNTTPTISEKKQL